MAVKNYEQINTATTGKLINPYPANVENMVSF